MLRCYPLPVTPEQSQRPADCAPGVSLASLKDICHSLRPMRKMILLIAVAALSAGMSFAYSPLLDISKEPYNANYWTDLSCASEKAIDTAAKKDASLLFKRVGKLLPEDQPMQDIRDYAVCKTAQHKIADTDRSNLYQFYFEDSFIELVAGK